MSVSEKFQRGEHVSGNIFKLRKEKFDLEHDSNTRVCEVVGRIASSGIFNIFEEILTRSVDSWQNPSALNDEKLELGLTVRRTTVEFVSRSREITHFYVISVGSKFDAKTIFLTRIHSFILFGVERDFSHEGIPITTAYNADDALQETLEFEVGKFIPFVFDKKAK